MSIELLVGREIVDDEIRKEIRRQPLKLRDLFTPASKAEINSLLDRAAGELQTLTEEVYKARSAGLVSPNFFRSFKALHAEFHKAKGRSFKDPGDFTPIPTARRQLRLTFQAYMNLISQMRQELKDEISYHRALNKR